MDLRTVDLLRPGPLELIEGFGEREAGAADSLSEALVLAPGDLALDQALQVFEMVPVLFGGGLGELVVVCTDERQLQPQQELVERVVVRMFVAGVIVLLIVVNLVDG